MKKASVFSDKLFNPVLIEEAIPFSKSMKSIIVSIEDDIGAKKILEQNKDKILKVKIDDINITKDFNTKDNFNS